MKVLVDKMPKDERECPFCQVNSRCHFTNLACPLMRSGCPYLMPLATFQTPEGVYTVKVGSDADKDRLNAHGVDWR